MSKLTQSARVMLADITPGQWGYHDFSPSTMAEEPSCTIIHADRFDWQAIFDGDYIAATPDWDPQSYDNAKFIAAAPELVRQLIAEVEALESALKSVRATSEQTLARIGDVPE